MTEVPLSDYASSLTNETQAQAEAEDGSIPKTFTRRVLEQLEEGGFVSNTTVAYHSEHGVLVYGFGYSEDHSVLDLYTTDFSLAPMDDRLTKAGVERSFKRLLAFLRKASTMREHFENTSEVYQLCEGVEKLLAGPPSVSKVRLFLFSNRESTARSLPEPTEFQGIPVEYQLWDLVRLYRHETSGSLGEPIVVDFDPPLPCLWAKGTESHHSVALAVVPGQRLAELYEEHRTRLLELNVRAFLQTRGKVNRGIRQTLLKEPDWFLSYNNGITATASRADFVYNADNYPVAISKLTGLQIVNGGQTTATLHHVHQQDKSELVGVDVQMKLTLVQPSDLAEAVPRISEYSNTQNKVTLVDFSSNDKFHVDFERVSRSLWAPAVNGAGQQTRWFYERARGAYAVEAAKHATPSAKRKFRAANPLSQKLSKADVAKFVNAWDSLPHLVSRGAQKNFTEFRLRINDRPPIVDVVFCRRVIAMGILFKAVDAVAKAHNAGSHKALITAYTVAVLCQMTERRIDLDRIWREQRVTDAVLQAADSLCPLVMSLVIQEGKHVTEWAKNAKCWDEVSRIVWQIPEELMSELASHPIDYTVDNRAEEKEQMARLEEIGVEEWEALAEWSRETRALTLSEQQLAATIAVKLATGGNIVPTQTRQGLEIHDKALSVGFRPLAL